MTILDLFLSAAYAICALRKSLKTINLTVEGAVLKNAADAI
jgi:hypothetical protein